MGNRISSRNTARCAIEHLENRWLLSAALANAAAISMAFDSSGILHAAYYDMVDHDLVYATRDSAGVWSSPTTIDADPNVGSELSLALNHSGQPGIAYYDAANGNLKYAHQVGQSWTTIIVDAKGNVGENPDLVFDRAGQPLISYYDATHHSLRVASITNNRPRVSTIASGTSAGAFSSIAANPSDGTFSITFESASSKQVRLARGKFGKLSQSVVASFSSGSTSAAAPAVAYGSDGKPKVSFVDPTTHALSLLSMAKHGWSSSLIASNSDLHQSVQLSFDETGMPLVLYGDLAGKVHVAIFSGGEWSSTSVGSGNSAGAALDTADGSVVIAASGAISQIDPGLAIPMNLAAQASSSGEVDLSWNESSTSATGFDLQRAAAGGAFITIATLGNLTTYIDTAVTQGTSYAYRLRAIDAAGTSLYSAAANASTPSDAPTNFVAQVSPDWAPWISLSWTDNAVAESGYRVERATDGVHFSTIDILPPDSTDYLDTIVDNERTYTYRVIPFDASGDGASSPTQAVVTSVAPPTDLQATVISAGRVDLSWTNVSSTGDHLEIDCIVDGQNAVVDANVPATATSYSVTTLSDGSPLSANTIYEFYVIAVRADGSAPSNPAYVLTGFDSPPNLEVDSLSSDQITLTWGDVLGESGYEIQSSPDNTNFTALVTTAADVTRYTLTGLTENTSYHFRIRALSAGGDSGFLWYALPTTELAQPTNVQGTALAGGSIQVDWTNQSSAATSYQISIAQGNGMFGNAITVPATNTAATISVGPNGPLQPGVTYRLQIVAMTAGNQSEPVDTGPITAIV